MLLSSLHLKPALARQQESAGTFTVPVP